MVETKKKRELESGGFPPTPPLCARAVALHT